MGMISQADLEQSDYNLLAAQDGLKAAQRTDENMTRSMDSLLASQWIVQSVIWILKTQVRM